MSTRSPIDLNWLKSNMHWLESNPDWFESDLILTSGYTLAPVWLPQKEPNFLGFKSSIHAVRWEKMFSTNVGNRNTHAIRKKSPNMRWLPKRACSFDWWRWSNLCKCMPFRQHAPLCRTFETSCQNPFFWIKVDIGRAKQATTQLICLMTLRSASPFKQCKSSKN
jgi:hypothetical protein